MSMLQVTDRSANLHLSIQNPTIRVSVTRNSIAWDDDSWTYHWQIIDTSWVDEDGVAVLVAGGSDLRGPATGEDPGPRAMLGTLMAHLGAAAEGYRAWMDRGLDPANRPESLEGWEDEVAEFAYVHADDLVMEPEEET